MRMCNGSILLRTKLSAVGFSSRIQYQVQCWINNMLHWCPGERQMLIFSCARYRMLTLTIGYLFVAVRLNLRTHLNKRELLSYNRAIIHLIADLMMLLALRFQE